MQWEDVYDFMYRLSIIIHKCKDLPHKNEKRKEKGKKEEKYILYYFAVQKMQ